ncbi:putative transcription factor GRAS family [Helianthus annuus]|nr:putative transcription factor GRAS family [Helianthus annuus]
MNTIQMIGPSSHQHQQKNNKDLHVIRLPQPQLLPLPVSVPVPLPSIHLRQLLFTAAQLISRSDLSAAHRLISILSSNSSAYGDSSERLVHFFTKALSLHLHHHHHHHHHHPIFYKINPPKSFMMTPRCNIDIYSDQYDSVLQSSYLSLNQITPFIRFSQFTANQAILELTDRNFHQQNIHIIDFDIIHGVQWPPLMQAIANHHPPPSLRLTATSTNLNILQQTGDRLSKFAHSLGLNFTFHPLLLPNTNNQTLIVDHLINHLSAVLLLPTETLAVNFDLYLHRHLNNRNKLLLLLRKIKSMNPKVVTLSEKEAYHNNPIFLSRFTEAMKYYTAVFESLEATLPPNSRERIEVEQVWFGREIADIVAEEGDCRKERHERFRSWKVMMARLLLRLHYPCEGYNLEVVGDSFFLGWGDHSLFSVSSWH